MTLPKAVRDELGLKAGDRLDVAVEDGRIVMISKNRPLSDLASLLPRPPRVVSIDEMNDAIARGAWERR